MERIREGFYSDKYFVRSREVLRADGHDPRVTMQVTCKTDAFVCGLDEAIAILKQCSDDWSALAVQSLYDGDHAEPWDTVMLIEGPYAAFAPLETLLLGVIGRRTRICTNTRRVVEAAHSKPVLFFPARHDYWALQPGDGYAARVAGAHAVSTDAQASWWGECGVGTVPHALIAAYGGDTVLATCKFAEFAGEGVDVVALVDYNNDCVGTSLAVARALDGRLWGVRLDTAENLVDISVLPQMGQFRPTGVNAQLVWNVRNALDTEGFGDVKIIVSGGFDVQRIRAFEEDGVPVDSYGVGASLLEGRFDFTADVVMVDGRPQSKVGRALRPNPRLERVR